MDQSMKIAFGSAVAGYCGYRLGSFVRKKRQALEAADKVIMLSNLYSEIAKWIGEEANSLDPSEFEVAFNEKLRFVALASKAFD